MEGETVGKAEQQNTKCTHIRAKNAKLKRHFAVFRPNNAEMNSGLCFRTSDSTASATECQPPLSAASHQAAPNGPDRCPQNGS
jgi:hypothetical protein